MSLILAPAVICGCARAVKHLPGWKRHRLRSLADLIYGVNTICAEYPSFRYNAGFPQPSVAVRELKRIQALAVRAQRTRNVHPLADRLEALKARKNDSYNLLAFQAARVLDPEHPSRMVQHPETDALLGSLARADPARLAIFAEAALEELQPLAKKGQGGDRNQGSVTKRDLILEIGLLFERVTGRKPGTTWDADDERFTGPFIEFAIAIFKGLGIKTSARQIFRLYKSLDLPEWRTGAHKGKRKWESRWKAESPQ